MIMNTKFQKMQEIFKEGTDRTMGILKSKIKNRIGDSLTIKVYYTVTTPSRVRKEWIRLYPTAKEANDWEFLEEKLSMYKESNETIKITKIEIPNKLA